MSDAPQILRRADGRRVEQSFAATAAPRTNRSLHLSPTVVHLDGGRRPSSDTALVSSAAVLTGTRVRRTTELIHKGKTRSESSRAWQEEAWYHWETTGALRYATRYEAAAMSKARLVATRRSPEPGADPEVLSRDHPVSRIVESMLGGANGQSRMLQTLSTHLYVAGLSYLVGWADGDEETWVAVTADELTVDDSTVRLRLSDNGNTIEMPRDTVVVIRIWIPHPRRWWEPDSTVRGAFTELRELEGFSKHTAATIDSRLIGAGLLLVPQEMSFVTDRTDLDQGQDPFVVEFIETAVTAMEDRSSAAANVPIVLRVPGAFIDKVKHVTFASPFDERVPDLREQALGRLAIALDLPKEILLGMAEASFRTAWNLDDSAIKMHFEPKLDRIVAGLTEGLLLPGLQDAVESGDITLDELGISDISELSEFAVGHDTAALRLRPNRTEDAESLHEDLLITDEARRRESGFSEDDAPEIGSEEWIIMVLRNAIVDQPQFADVILPVLGQVLDNKLLMDIQPVTGTDGRRDEGANNAPDDNPPPSPGGNETSPSNDGE